MKRYCILLLFILISECLFSQKDTQEIITAHGIKNISIDLDEVYEIRITAKKQEFISIKTHSEGEYFNNIKVNSIVEGNKLIINSEYPERLTGGFDKLSAHKVFSLGIMLEIPEEMEVLISSNIASVIGRGSFKFIEADLKQGYCQLLEFNGHATINTFRGNILVETSSGKIEAESRHGKVEVPQFFNKQNSLKLTSLDGDIIVRKN